MEVPEYLIRAVDDYCIRCWTNAVRNCGYRMDCYGESCPVAYLSHGDYCAEEEYREAIQEVCEDCPSFSSREGCKACELYAVRNEGTA